MLTPTVVLQRHISTFIAQASDLFINYFLSLKRCFITFSLGNGKRKGERMIDIMQQLEQMQLICVCGGGGGEL